MHETNSMISVVQPGHVQKPHARLRLGDFGIALD